MRHPLQHAIVASGFVADAAQRDAIRQLRKLYDALCDSETASSGLLAKFFGKHNHSVQGLYLWGGVGRGKTHLTDLLYDVLPIKKKLRLHFHRFMRQVHVELGKLKNVESPLLRVGESFAARTRVLFLDEMHIVDITDAMLIHGLLSALFERGITLVTTSNSPPHELYKDGLQRDRFAPAIQLLEQHTTVFELAGDTDYRLRTLRNAEIYHVPLDETAPGSLAKNFDDMAAIQRYSGTDISVNERAIPIVRCAEGIVWFEFVDLCDGPRSKDDYIEIARLFHTVIVANVPCMSERENDQARRFVTMIDEFYDRNVKLVVSAAAEPEELYTGERLVFEFTRTASRLREMRTVDYLSRKHLS
jgi:cell division protein ZapE